MHLILLHFDVFLDQIGKASQVDVFLPLCIFLSDKYTLF